VKDCYEISEVEDLYFGEKKLLLSLFKIKKEREDKV